MAESAAKIEPIGVLANTGRIGYGLNTKPQGHESQGYQWVLGNARRFYGICSGQTTDNVSEHRGRGCYFAMEILFDRIWKLSRIRRIRAEIEMAKIH